MGQTTPQVTGGFGGSTAVEAGHQGRFVLPLGPRPRQLHRRIGQVPPESGCAGAEAKQAPLSQGKATGSSDQAPGHRGLLLLQAPRTAKGKHRWGRRGSHRGRSGPQGAAPGPAGTCRGRVRALVSVLLEMQPGALGPRSPAPQKGGGRQRQLPPPPPEPVSGPPAPAAGPSHCRGAAEPRPSPGQAARPGRAPLPATAAGPNEPQSPNGRQRGLGSG